MNLSTLKKEAREEFNKEYLSFDEYPRTYELYLFLDTLIDKVVDAVEESVVPMRYDGSDEMGLEIPVLFKTGWNRSLECMKLAFTNFKK